MVTFSEALQDLLRCPDDAEVQVLYITLKSGKVLVFLGSAVSEEDFDQIDDVVLGECISPSLIKLVSLLGSGTTAQ